MIQVYQKKLSGNRVGVVFGSFSPLHQGHLDIIYQAKKENDAQKSLENKLEEAYKDYHVQMRATDRRIVQIYKVQRKNYLEFLGYEVTYASNVTDVDDKIIASALKNNQDEIMYAHHFADVFLKNVKELGKFEIIPLRR